MTDALYEAGPRTDGTIAPAPASPEVTAAARRLPNGVGLGTLGWFDPAWRGSVFDAFAPERADMIEALRAYAAHPLMSTVEWAWPRERTLSERYLESVAQASGTLDVVCRASGRLGDACLRTPKGEPAGENPDFLSIDRALKNWLHPCARHFGTRAHLLLDLLYDHRRGAYGAEARKALAARLEAFLKALSAENPAGLTINVAVRSRALFTPAFFDLLKRSGARPAFTVASTGIDWPALSRGLKYWMEVSEVDDAPLLIRWLGSAARGPLWVRGPRRDSLGAIACAGLAAKLARSGRKVEVVVSQRAEGDAPASLLSIAQALAQR